ncbi:hypothetical protein HAX54_009142 [Datura stramonium]|uniref:39S ribosomal protein L9, mitochondrial n=1 Tax=Datura stramonium TaxID=4076 RepID=A0ABS8TED6_DATST|nr:hypothetical protein [Datura stramonium]
MRDQDRQSYTSLPFPVLVMNLCHNAGVPKIEKTNDNIWETRVIDITNIQDEINSKLNKRKWEPMVPHASETAKARMVQVENITTRNNTRLTSLIEHMPNVIKRAINKAVAPFHVKIQLHPDLSIFDAPLPKDEVFEDEKVETNEEELEEEQVTKEIDEERQVEVSIQRSMDDVTAGW